ncbi:MAG: cation-translocating P-type ATPase [Defluviitaleaceae bacterium]|nr:cation-translocating P-type ATPase [Defluviitaleaceae bacterium]
MENYNQSTPSQGTLPSTSKQTQALSPATNGQYFNHSSEAVIETFNTSRQGLSQDEAANRIGKYGYNQLNSASKTHLLKLVLDAWKDPMMLILAAVVIIKAALGEFIEAVVIMAVLIVNSAISVAQTRKAESSLEALRQISAPVATVRRAGEVVTIPAKELVPGDIVLLEAGDFVPADGRLISCNALKIDEGLLTGESEPVLKQEDALEGSLKKALGDRKNMVFSGTIAVHGRGEFLVTGTGKQAEIGKIATLIETAQDRQTPLQRRLEDFSKKLGLAIMALCALIFAVQIYRAVTDGGELQSVILGAFLFALAVAVAAIPEALSPIVTIVLAVGTKKMAAQSAIIRKLPAVEALGSTGVICTDKTGTLTQNKMTVIDHFLGGIHAERRLSTGESQLLHAMTLCNNAIVKTDGTSIGDPTETALLAFADKAGKPHGEIRSAYVRVAELPFDSARKLMSVVVSPSNDAAVSPSNDYEANKPGIEPNSEARHDANKKILFTKGAPDILFPRAEYVLVNGEAVPITPELLAQFEAANNRFGNGALRVLAYATKIIHNGEAPSFSEEDTGVLLQEEAGGLTLIGLTAMIDPPRSEVYESIAAARAAHIKTVMITGDHKNTAFAIAKEIGIAKEGDIAVTGIELDAMTETELDEKLESISVYARVSPENKMTIVNAWQRKGMITAMTGDGVNDAPSLKQADIGVAMGSGTEVAKDASAMVLTDDNFASIVSAIATGRTVFDNIKKAVGYLFSGNLAAIIAILFAFTMGWDSPLTALQILFINLVNDSLPAIALGLEKSEPSVMSRPPRPMNEGIFGGGLFASVIKRGVLIGAVAIASQFIGITWFSPALGGAMAFTTIILARTLQTFSSRSNSQTIFRLGLGSNPYVMGAVITCLGMYGFTILPGLRFVFHIPEGFALVHFGVAAGLAVGVVLVMEAVKWIRGMGGGH